MVEKNVNNYSELREKIDQIEEKLGTCAETLQGINPEEKKKYENPQYRMWSGDTKDLEGFSSRLEEWLNQPLVAEARRYLSDLKKWSELSEKISLEEIEKDWRFLSDSLEEIKEIHEQAKTIAREGIRKKASTWILNRVIEKDLERAKNWAINAQKFAGTLNELEQRKTESRLAEEVKRGILGELLKISSFESDNQDIILQHQELIDRAENIIKNKPTGISEEAILNTYDDKIRIDERLSIIGTELSKIRTSMINLEWVKEFPNVKDHNKLWIGKKAALSKNNLESIGKALEHIQQQAESWKEARKIEVEITLARIGRMLKSLGKKDIAATIAGLEEKRQSIDWNRPDLGRLSEILGQIGDIKKQLREELATKLQNEDAILMIEEPDIIEDLGKRKDWDFERFIKALEVALHNGLIEIRAAEE